MFDVNELSGWGISQQIAEIVENGFTFDEETGEVIFTTDDLDKLEGALDKKFESLAGIYQMYNSKADSLKARSKEVADSAKAFERKSESIKRYINTLMELNHKDKVEVGDKKISYRKSTSSNITDEKELMEWINSSEENKQKYLKYKEPEISKKALSDAAKAGEEIKGFALVENKNLIIK